MVDQASSGSRTLSDAILHALSIFILSVTVLDIFKTVQQSDTLFEDEKNPIAAHLITRHKKTVVYYTGPDNVKNEVIHETGDVSKLVLVKIVGLMLASAMLRWLIACRRHYAAVVLPTVALLQLLLLLILSR